MEMSKYPELSFEDLLENPSERIPSTKGTPEELARKHFRKILVGTLNQYNIPYIYLKVRFEDDIDYNRFRILAMWNEYDIVLKEKHRLVLEKKVYSIVQSFTYEMMSDFGNYAGEIFIVMLKQMKKELEDHCQKTLFTYLEAGLSTNFLKGIVHSSNYAQNIEVVI